MTRLKEAMLLLIANDAPLREAEIVDIPFLGALAGCSARRSERRVASHTSEEQRRNAPARAAKNGVLAFSASLSSRRGSISRLDFQLGGQRQHQPKHTHRHTQGKTALIKKRWHLD